jgi:hypothetical protein
VAGVVLVLYGAALTSGGLAVQVGVLQAAGDADERALRWHTYLWDPWFLAWGVLLLATLRRTRPGAGPVGASARTGASV